LSRSDPCSTSRSFCLFFALIIDFNFDKTFVRVPNGSFSLFLGLHFLLFFLLRYRNSRIITMVIAFWFIFHEFKEVFTFSVNFSHGFFSEPNNLIRKLFFDFHAFFVVNFAVFDVIFDYFGDFASLIFSETEHGRRGCQFGHQNSISFILFLFFFSPSFVREFSFEFESCMFLENWVTFEVFELEADVLPFTILLSFFGLPFSHLSFGLSDFEDFSSTHRSFTFFLSIFENWVDGWNVHVWISSSH